MSQSTELDLPFKPALPPAPNSNGSMLDVIERAARDAPGDRAPTCSHSRRCHACKEPHQ